MAKRTVAEGRRRAAGPPDAKSVEREGAELIRCEARLRRPRVGAGKGAKSGAGGDSWSFLRLPAAASGRLRSRGMVSIRGALNGSAFAATLQPDGEGGHWLRVEKKVRAAAGVEVGEVVRLEFSPVLVEPEPEVPADLRKALAAAPAKARDAWKDITPAARRDFVHWIVSPKKAQTRVKRIEMACDMLAKGKRRPCCFDRSGKFDGSLGCPVAEE